MLATIEVLILGVFHMSNPGHDLHNQTVPDVLAPQQQAELQKVAESLAAFRPTRVAVEWPKEVVAERWPKCLAGTLPPSRNEVVQLGFRLAKQAGAEIEGIDVDGDFPYEPVQAWADAHGKRAELNAMQAEVERAVQQQSEALARGGIAGELKLLNDPARIAREHGFYRALAAFGDGADQPGVALQTAWYRRNFLLCAKLAQSVKPGERVVVMYGAGHAYLLRQCVAEMPGWTLAEPARFLP